MTAVPASLARIAVCGCGYWGKNLVRNFHELGALAAVCDVTAAGRERAGRVAPGTPTVDRIDDVLAEGVDAVVLATPAATHFELARRALAAGKDVLAEKPLALECDEARELVELADAAGRILMVGHVLEYHPAVRAIVAMVRGGELGELQYLYSNRLNLGKVRTEENILWSFAPHDVAVILRLVGALPRTVVAAGGSWIQPGIADVTTTSLLFASDVRAHVFVSWLHPFKEQRLVVVGSKKMVTFCDVTKQLEIHDKHVAVGSDGPVPVRGDGSPVAFADDEPLRLECEAFLDAVAIRQPPLTDGKSGLDTLRVLEAAQRSLAAGGVPASVT